LEEFHSEYYLWDSNLQNSSGILMLPYRFHLFALGYFDRAATHNEHISLVIAAPALGGGPIHPSHQRTNRITMAGKALKVSLFASALVASVIAIPLAASAQSGIASVYAYSGERTANGERASPGGLTAAHRTLPFGTMVRVTNNRSGRSVVVRINDRGPFVRGRVIDLTPAGARALGFSGLTNVTLDVVGRS
jgi:rare lipoprotein A